jgi:hypothetical protein
VGKVEGRSDIYIGEKMKLIKIQNYFLYVQRLENIQGN